MLTAPSGLFFVLFLGLLSVSGFLLSVFKLIPWISRYLSDSMTFLVLLFSGLLRYG